MGILASGAYVALVLFTAIAAVKYRQESWGAGLLFALLLATISL